MIIEVVLSLAISTVIGGIFMLFIWGMAISQLFIPQQHRLLSVAPEHANVILALNNSTFYLGIAGGAALGGLALRSVPVTQLGFIGAGFVLLALLLFTLSLRFSKNKSQTPLAESNEVKEMIVVPE
ncbi:hypothetical protein [Dictyobacter kobayashii]|uniref:hypothetical protein n=1 Tax=Dictyobacter kobayashii TaxID=2014872 RepID=UPI000F844CCB|nr:hypothetical protein [Dictyobacter kobayashii]